MNRSLLVTVHMSLSAFFAAFILLVSISGGLYLMDVKGSVSTATVYRDTAYALDAGSANLYADVGALLVQAGVTDYSFEYVKVSGNTLYTRPTSRLHYVIKLGEGVEVVRAQPSLQSALIELHKGHGPTAFKQFQKAFAVSLLLIIVSGLWLGLSAPRLRARTLYIASAGALSFAALVLF